MPVSAPFRTASPGPATRVVPTRGNDPCPNVRSIASATNSRTAPLARLATPQATASAMLARTHAVRNPMRSIARPTPIMEDDETTVAAAYMPEKAVRDSPVPSSR